MIKSKTKTSSARANRLGMMGGRRLTDDVVDATFTMTDNGVPLTDYVNGNEVPFRNVFPFVADPDAAVPAGPESGRSHAAVSSHNGGETAPWLQARRGFLVPRSMNLTNANNPE